MTDPRMWLLVILSGLVGYALGRSRAEARANRDRVHYRGWEILGRPTPGGYSAWACPPHQDQAAFHIRLRLLGRNAALAECRRRIDVLESDG